MSPDQYCKKYKVCQISIIAVVKAKTGRTFYGMILNVFVRHGGRHGQGVTPDAGSDVRDAEWQRGTLGLVNQAWHGCRLAAVLSHTQSCAGGRL